MSSFDRRQKNIFAATFSPLSHKLFITSNLTFFYHFINLGLIELKNLKVFYEINRKVIILCIKVNEMEVDIVKN